MDGYCEIKFGSRSIGLGNKGLNLKDVGDLALPGGRAAEGDVALDACPFSVEKGQLFGCPEFFKHGVKRDINTRIPDLLVGQGTEQVDQDTREGVHFELLIGPVVGGLPVEKAHIFHLLETFLDSGQTPMRSDDMLRASVKMIGDQG